jgi:hypothetical protein
MITEEDREGRYWKLSLFFMLLSPLTVYQLVRLHYAFVGVHYSVEFPLLLLGFCVLSVPLSLVVDTILIKLFDTTSVLRFWVVKPTDEVRHLLSRPARGREESFEGTLIESTVDTINSRLVELGFQTAISEKANDSSVITFRKTKKDPILSFIDHSFFGEARVRWFGSAVEVRVRTTFDDTLVLETGEFARIRALGNYLSLQAQEFSYRNVPLAVYCGLNLAFLTTILATIPYLNRQVGNLVLTCLTAAAGGMILAALVLVQKKKERPLGYRLALAGLYLSLLPFVSLLAKSLR